jgi:thioredoxin
VLIDFWAPWCGPCRAVAPEIAAVAKRNAGRLLVAKVNTDVDPQVGTRYRIQSIPTMAVFKERRRARPLVGRPAGGGHRAFRTRRRRHHAIACALADDGGLGPGEDLRIRRALGEGGEGGRWAAPPQRFDVVEERSVGAQGREILEQQRELTLLAERGSPGSLRSRRRR